MQQARQGLPALQVVLVQRELLELLVQQALLERLADQRRADYCTEQESCKRLGVAQLEPLALPVPVLLVQQVRRLQLD